MFSKITRLLTAMLLVAAVLPISVVKAQDSSIIPSEKHYYTVQLRSDKRVLNYARIIFENKNDDQDISTYTFSLPKGISASSLEVKQVLAKKTDAAQKPCKTYESFDEWKTRAGYSYFASYDNASSYYKSLYDKQKQCLEYDTTAPESEYDENFDYFTDISSSQSYYNYYYYSQPNSQFDYSNLKIDEKDGEYTVSLAQAVSPGKQGSILVSYVADGMVSGFLGRYSYEYRTLVVKNMVSEAVVAINFDEGMYTRDGAQKRQIETSSSEGTTIQDGLAAAGNASESRATDTVLFNVGKGGVYTKTQSNLLPGDVMSVKGVYAEGPIRLFLKEIVTTLVIIALIFAGWWFLGRRYYRSYRSKHSKGSGEPHSDLASDSLSSPEDSRSAGTVLLSNKEMIFVSVKYLVFSAAVIVALFLLFSGIEAVSSSLSGGRLVPAFWIILIPSLFFTFFLLPLAHVLIYGGRTAQRWIRIHAIVFVVASLALILILFFWGLAPPTGDTLVGFL